MYKPHCMSLTTYKLQFLSRSYNNPHYTHNLRFLNEIFCTWSFKKLSIVVLLCMEVASQIIQSPLDNSKLVLGQRRQPEHV
jgi:hypothetical protein